MDLMKTANKAVKLKTQITSTILLIQKGSHTAISLNQFDIICQCKIQLFENDPIYSFF